MNIHKRILLIILILFVLITAALLSFLPHVVKVEPVAFQSFSDDSNHIHQAYEDLCNNYGTEHVYPEDSIQVVTLKNLWHHWEYYILPCYIVNTSNVPKAGQSVWSASLNILVVPSNEPVFFALPSVKMQNFTLNLKADSGTFISENVKVNPDLGARIDSPKVIINKTIDCSQIPQITAFYNVGTGIGVKNGYENATVEFIWQYNLELCGKEICSYMERTVSRNYLLGS